MSNIENPAEIILAVDWEDPSQPWEGWFYASRGEMDKHWNLISQRYKGVVNALYCDGHIVGHDEKSEILGSDKAKSPWFEKQYLEERRY